jgi:hypothetical protein
MTIFWVKSYKILRKLAQIFFFSMTKKFFSPLSCLAAFGSGIRDPGLVKNQDPG